MRIFLCVVICIGTLFGCLEPEGENFREITNPSTVVLELTAPTSEVIILDRPTSFTYTLNGASIYVLEIDVLFGDEMIGPVIRNGDGTFTVDPSRIPPGNYQMHVTIKGHNRDASIASYLASEILEFSNTYNVYIDSAPPPPLEVVKFEAADGMLKVFWNKCRNKNFVEYKLLRCQSGVCIETKTTNANDTSWVDPYYIAGEVQYYVDLTTELSTVRGEVKTYDWQPEIWYEVKDLKATYHWKQFPFYKNLDRLKVTSPKDFPVELAPDETSLENPARIRFGEIILFELTVVPKSGIEQTFATSYFVGQSKPAPSVLPRIYNTKASLYYGYYYSYGSSSVVVMDLNLNELYREETNMVLASSANGEYLVGQLDGSLYKLDPRTLQRTPLGPTGLSYVTSSFQVANNGLILCGDGATFKVFDGTSGTQIFSLSGYQVGILSSSGNHIGIANNNTIYRYNGTTFVSPGTLPFNTNTVAFDLNDNIIGLLNGPDGERYLNVYDVNTRASVKNISARREYVDRVVVDPVTGIITYARSGDSYYIYDPIEDHHTQTGPNPTYTLNGWVFTQSWDGSLLSIEASELF